MSGPEVAFLQQPSFAALAHEAIIGALGPEALAQLHSLQVLAETTSTQDDASAMPAPAHGCAVFLAERQSAGQGRRGRAWISADGSSLTFSLARRFGVPLAALSGLSLVTGVAVAEALQAQGFAGIGLKWPNDLVVDDRKLGGILVQLRALDAGSAAVIGVGINVAMPAADAARIDQPWCDLQTIAGPDRELDRNVIAAAVFARLLPALAQFEQAGFAGFLPLWQALDALRDRPVRILDGERVHEGRSLGITGEGALRLRLDDGAERCFHGGEVSVRPA